MARPKVSWQQHRYLRNIRQLWMEGKNINIAIQGITLDGGINIIECPRTRSTKIKQKNMNRTSNERPYQPKENKDQELGAYYELTEMNGKATEYKHIGEATQQIEQQHVRSSLKSQKMVITLC